MCDDEERPGPHNFEDTFGCAGCTCTMSTTHSASIDPPEPIRDPWCPVHSGRDPDAELEQSREDNAYFDSIPRDEED